MKLPRRNHGQLLDAPHPATQPSAAETVKRLNPVTVAIVIAALYWGRDVIIPVVLAGLLAFVLNPLVTRLTKLRLPHTLAVLAASAMALAVLVLASAFVSTQVRELATELPTYQATVKKKMANLRATLSRPGAVDQLSSIFGTVERELTEAQKEAQRRAGPAPVPTTSTNITRVEVVPPTTSPLERLALVFDSLSGPLVTAGIVLVLMVLMLLDRADIRDRMLRLLGDDLHRNTDALGEVGHRVSRYLVMQLMVNSLYGIPLAIGLAFIGVPGALLWGMLGALLRFVPYVGPMVASAFPLLLAVAVDPGWSMALWVLVLIVALELISNNIIEPWVYGASTGLSALSLVVAAMFWSVLWGPAVGLLVSTPLTVVLLVLSRYVPQLAIFDLLLSRAPALDEPTRFYQRLVAGAVHEATAMAQTHAEQHGAAAFLDNVAAPSVTLARLGTVGEASDQHCQRYMTGMGHVLAEMREQHHVPQAQPPVIVCVGARDRLGALGADVLAHRLTLAGLPCVTAEGETAGRGWMGAIDTKGIAALALVYLDDDPTAAAHARHTCRRLARAAPGVALLVVAGPTAEESPADKRWAFEETQHVMPTLHAVVAWATQHLPLQAAAGSEVGPSELGPSEGGAAQAPTTDERAAMGSAVATGLSASSAT